MFKNIAKLSLVFLGLTLQSFSASADRPHDGWDIHANGFIELDNLYDSTRTFTEQNTGAAVAPSGTINGDNGRTQMSVRQTRLYLKLNTPDADGWKTKGWFEGDFSGFDPTSTPGSTAVSQSESAYYGVPNFRLRNAYAETSNESWHFLFGQNWTIFGYQPYFEMMNTSGGAPINLVQRNPQIKVSKDITVTDSIKGTADVAVSRPTQRDGNIPNLDAGIRLNYDGRKSGMLHWASNEFVIQPTSIGISGTLRNFSTPNTDLNDADKQTFMGGGIAVSGILPILTSDGENMKNNLTFVGEFINGSGIVDNYFGFTGGFAQMANNTAFTGASGVATPAALVPNLDAGIAGYDASGNFQLVQTQSFTAELQYVLPTEAKMAINLEYARVHSVNAGSLANLGNPATAPYDFNELLGAEFVYDFAPNWRVIAEYSRMSTHYLTWTGVTAPGSGQYPSNNRYSVSTYFMF